MSGELADNVLADRVVKTVERSSMTTAQKDEIHKQMMELVNDPKNHAMILNWMNEMVWSALEDD